MRENIEYPEKTIVTADGRRSREEAAVICEHILSVIVNEVRVFSLVCTKDRLKELVTGRLYTEGLIDKLSDIKIMRFCLQENEARVFLNHSIDWEEYEKAEPSCCTANKVYKAHAGRRRLETLTPVTWKPEWVFSLAERFSKGEELHKKTQGTHSCILLKEGDILFSCEDIGRHNAIDKVIGYGLTEDIPLEGCVVFTSGRVPVDMVEKVITAGIPVLVSKSVPTLQSVELAKEHGLTLICRAWPDRFEIFSPDPD